MELPLDYSYIPMEDQLMSEDMKFFVSKSVMYSMEKRSIEILRINFELEEEESVEDYDFINDTEK